MPADCYTLRRERQHISFTGDNGHALRKELSRWRLTFEEKYGPENIEQLDGSKTSSNELTDSVATLPFLAEKRMVIVHQIPKSTKEQIQLGNQHSPGLRPAHCRCQTGQANGRIQGRKGNCHCQIV